MTTRTFTNTGYGDAAEEADWLNQLYSSGVPVLFNGYTVRRRFGAPAQVWTNGSLSVEVQGKDRNKTRTLWVKVGQTATVEEGDR